MKDRKIAVYNSTDDWSITRVESVWEANTTPADQRQTPPAADINHANGKLHELEKNQIPSNVGNVYPNNLKNRR